MKKKLNIINIDGPQGVGKSSQVALLKNYLDSIGVKCKVLKLQGNIPSAIDCIHQTYKFLEEADGVLITDGSIAEMIQIDINSGIPYLEIQEKYREVLHHYEVMYYAYGMANILLTIDDLEVCKQRIEKRAKLFKNEPDFIDKKLEKELIDGLKIFNNYMFTNNLKFHVIETESGEKMLDVHKKIVSILKENYQVKSLHSEAYK